MIISSNSYCRWVADAYFVAHTLRICKSLRKNDLRRYSIVSIFQDIKREQ